MTEFLQYLLKSFRQSRIYYSPTVKNEIYVITTGRISYPLWRKKGEIFCFLLGIIRSYRTGNGFDKRSTSRIRNVHPLELSLYSPILSRVTTNTPIIRTKLQCSVQSKGSRYRKRNHKKISTKIEAPNQKKGIEN